MPPAFGAMIFLLHCRGFAWMQFEGFTRDWFITLKVKNISSTASHMRTYVEDYSEKKTLLLLSNIFHYCAAFCLRQCKITFWNFSLDNSNFCAKKHWPIKEPFWDKNKIFCRFILDNVYFEVGFHMKKLCDWRWQRFYQECSYVLCVLLSYAIYLLSSFIFCCGAIELQCNAKQLIPWNVCVYMSLDKDALSSTFVS